MSIEFACFPADTRVSERTLPAKQIDRALRQNVDQMINASGPTREARRLFTEEMWDDWNVEDSCRAVEGTSENEVFDILFALQYEFWQERPLGRPVPRLILYDLQSQTSPSKLGIAQSRNNC